MTRLISLSVFLFSLAACATSEPPVQTQVVAGTSAQQIVAPVSSDEAESDGPLDVLAVPAAQQKAANPGKKEDYLVCKEELILGSHRKEVVCRYKSEIEEVRQQTQRELRRMSLRPGGNRR